MQVAESTCTIAFKASTGQDTSFTSPKQVRWLSPETMRDKRLESSYSYEQSELLKMITLPQLLIQIPLLLNFSFRNVFSISNLLQFLL